MEARPSNSKLRKTRVKFIVIAFIVIAKHTSAAQDASAVCDMIRPGGGQQFMRIVLNVIGFALIAMGTIWILQGVNILPGSFMTGQTQWAWRGAAVALLGLITLGIAYRRGQKR